MNSVTVTDEFLQNLFYNLIEIHGFTAGSFVGGYRKAQPVSNLSSISLVFCIVVHVMKKERSSEEWHIISRTLNHGFIATSCIKTT
jgi:hypothetical protein